jgi:hypothetical protein
VIADVDGDGLKDLVLGWTDLDDEGGPDGGTLRWIPGDASGGFGEPRTLHGLSVVDLVAAEIDGRPGADLVAVHWADGFGRRPSEAWVFGGGPSPRRIARRRLRHDGVATDLADLDGDGHLDLITLDAEGAQIAEGDGTGRFPRFRSLPLEAPRDVVVMPAGAPRPPPPAPEEPAAPIEAGEAAEEPETHTDLVHLVGATMTTLDAEGQLGDPTPGAPHGVLRAHGLGDGAIVALTRQRVVRVSHGSESTLVDLPGTFRPADLELMGRESDAPSLLVLGRTARGWELVQAQIDSEGVVRLEPTAEPSEPKEAPLVLRLTLH